MPNYRRVALVTHALNGGVWTTTRFIQRLLEQRTSYSVDIIVLATSARDKYSIRILQPSTWYKRLSPAQITKDTQSYLHVGAYLSELEFQRYQPRAILTDLLNQYDLVQVVGGSPAWAAAAMSASPPICAFAATTYAQERRILSSQTRGLRWLWLRLMAPIVETIERQTLSRLDHVFAESKYTYDLFASYVAPERMSLGPPGVDAHFYQPASSYHADGHILCVGRLSDERKNLSLLLNAYHQLRNIFANAPKLVLVSQEPLAPKAEHQINILGLKDHVQIRVNLSLSELRQCYQEASLFVLSSDEEGLGIVILEAMASGLPVISTDCGGPATIVSHNENGLLVPIGDIASFAEAIKSLLTRPDIREDMGRVARQKVESHFSIEAAGQVYLDVYKEFLV